MKVLLIGLGSIGLKHYQSLRKLEEKYKIEIISYRMSKNSIPIEGITNISSIYRLLGRFFSVYDGTNKTMPVAYSAIKGGIVNLTRYLATYYGKFGLKVYSVAPGGIFDNQDIKFAQNYEKLTPLSSMRKPMDIAAVVRFLKPLHILLGKSLRWMGDGQHGDFHERGKIIESISYRS